ncbi:MAG: hypothetical protein O3B87_04200 [bacterium]|nr:hypothetical protein [bacterium]
MENLGIDVKLIVAQMVSFGVFYLVFAKFISKPLFGFLKKQKEQEELREKLASDLESRNAKLEEKDKAMDKERKAALTKAISASKKEALTVKDEIIAQAKNEAAAIVESGKAQVQAEREAMEKGIRTEIAKVSVMLVEKALQDYLTPSAQKDITKHIIEQAPKAKI